MPDRASRRPAASVGALAALVAMVGLEGLWSAPPVGAENVSREQLEALAGQARRDPAALRRLRQVDAVDGRRVDLGRALAGAEGQVLDARLRALAGGVGGGVAGGPAGGAPAPSAASARADA
ncbi:MAG: hypothetical protein M3P85_16340, partial [Actinomycetota bacterium]|nr:hypothetical protein [Actinomycetota bacterium]